MSNFNLTCSYLYHQWDHFRLGGRVKRHQHAFWHLDCQLTSGTVLHLDEETLHPQKGQVTFIPAHTYHEWIYPKHNIRCLTLKIDVSGQAQGLLPQVITPGPFSEKITELLKEALPKKGRPTEARREIIEFLAGTLIREHYPQTSPPRDRAPSIIQAIKDIITQSEGRMSSLQELSQKTGYSVSHLSARFREHEGVALKTYLDRERARQASGMLKYGDMNVTEVARALGFNDVFSLSRFFKRVTGKSPRAFRNESG